ncbi:TPA: alpha/beta fold hydrolase [Legionella bozemanae]
MIFNEKNAQFLADQISGAHHYRFMKCGHLPQIEYPELFTQTVRGFIDRLS